MLQGVYNSFLSGPRYPDGSEMHYGPPPYAGQVCEPAFSNQRWNFQPRAMNHREMMPYRPPAGGPIPVAGRGILLFLLPLSKIIILKVF